LNNILIHELGHLLDRHNTTFTDRERYAEWFAIHFGYKPSRRATASGQPARRRHHGTAHG
jgi:predicted Zn-dependent protease